MAAMDSSRDFVKDVKRVVIKVGTAVVTRSDGRLALGRIGCLCEQIKELNYQGYEVILVTSGLLDFADLQKPQVDLDGKACAAVGQSGLMALYDALFSQLDVASSQLLVTDKDFEDTNFRMQLSETVNSLLDLKVIPIFNENDAISTRRAPYEDSSGIFWDNDSLAGLLALELKADLLVLLSDVEGLYSGPPSEPGSKIIHTYMKEVHQAKITFGSKSRVGRGGMTAKVKAAVCAASAGIPVVISSTQGRKVGTLFHQHAEKLVSLKEIGARDMAVSARECSRRFQNLSSEERKKILLDVADALEANEKLIRTENEADVAAAKLAGYEKSLVSRLTLKPGKISSLANSIRVLADMEEPIGQVLKRTELADGLVLEKTACPCVLLIVFESRPDALVQIASLALRSGNGLLLKGGKEAARSNAVLHKAVGEKLIALVTSRDEIPDLLKLDDVIDLVIPRGSNKLVSQIKEATKIPVLGHADGICHVYVDKSADMKWRGKSSWMQRQIIQPLETLLVHQDLVKGGQINDLVMALRLEGVTLYGGPRASAELDIPQAGSFHHEYNTMACTIEIVDDVVAAINHIHSHGSAHTDCVVAEDEEVAESFLRGAAVFHNASTRFCDGARFGLGAEVGISTGRIHARGPVGLLIRCNTRNRLLISPSGEMQSRILRGHGQAVDGDKGVLYTHKNLL
ncbi:unnamed protein product [Spirodela intermedia]|uniref:Delta-1-pyrroline-5-carboxylate synthase n=1 Tax=Spirodela intermedia TaxID=51605 RepID=A0A7I8IFW8_SPIIN|nr:unnamed protein product [Spirodela intermedia]CAA6656782.1 unnamed protein product [Spirodela intermedia]